MLQFVDEPDPTIAAEALTKRLVQELEADRRVLWLVCGGSNIALSNQVIRKLPKDRLQQLTCLLSDERYGRTGHADSNYQQLTDIGFMEFMADGLRFEPVLVPELTMQDTCKRYGDIVTKTMAAADSIIAQPGIGSDGHIAGILPRSTAVDNPDPVVGYNAGVFQRITITPPMLRKIDAAYCYVYGKAKWPTLQRLRSETLSLAEQPAQILKEVREAYIFSDLR